MRRRYLLFIVFALSFAFLVACQSLDTDQKVVETKEKVINNQEIDYKTVAQYAAKRVDKLKILDSEKRKWAIRIVGQAEIANETLNDSDILERTTNKMIQEKKWFELANHYGVRVSDEETKRYIDDIYTQGKNNPQAQRFAEGLGIDLKELFYTFDFNLHKKNLTWEKLIPILKNEYDLNDNNELIKKFNEEVNQ